MSIFRLVIAQGTKEGNKAYKVVFVDTEKDDVTTRILLATEIQKDILNNDALYQTAFLRDGEVKAGSRLVSVLTTKSNESDDDNLSNLPSFDE